MRIVIIGTLLSVPFSAMAFTYDTSNLPYNDVPAHRATAIAVSTLTELGIVRGNPDGTFKPGVPLNRAEFIKIAMGLLPQDDTFRVTRCFPDIDPALWFALAVCRAKSLGIVSGNALPDVSPDLWPFEPTRSVKYEEALKILTGIYGVPLAQGSGGEWYEKYVRSANSLDLSLGDSTPGSALTRGQMARLTVAFIAHSRGELDALRFAESHPPIPVRTVFDASSSSSEAFSSLSSAASSIESASEYDPLLSDTSTNDSVLVLGTVTRILGSAKLFSNNEPIRIQSFIIDLVAGNTSLSSLKVYDHDGKFLGTASVDTATPGGTRFRLRVKTDGIVLPHRQTYSFYVRGVLRPEDTGGTSGGSLQVDRMGIEGVGAWSTRNYEQFTQGESFAQSTVARSAITSITNAGESRAFLTEGTDLEIGAFRFEGVVGHSAARLQITAIDFTAGLVSAITLSNISIKVDGGNERHACSIAGNTITCSGLPASFGRLEDGPRVLRVFANINVPDTTGSAAVQLSINDPGTISSPGDITWTDGVTTFTWVDIDYAPLARGTYYSY